MPYFIRLHLTLAVTGRRASNASARSGALRGWAAEHGRKARSLLVVGGVGQGAPHLCSCLRTVSIPARIAGPKFSNAHVRMAQSLRRPEPASNTDVSRWTITQ